MKEVFHLKIMTYIHNMDIEYFLNVSTALVVDILLQYFY